jgi:hypothetical protein
MKTLPATLITNVRFQTQMLVHMILQFKVTPKVLLTSFQVTDEWTVDVEVDETMM